MTKFQYNKETGKLEIWRDGKKIGEMDTMGDEIIHGDTYQGQQRNDLSEDRRRKKSNT